MLEDAFNAGREVKNGWDNQTIKYKDFDNYLKTKENETTNK